VILDKLEDPNSLIVLLISALLGILLMVKRLIVVMVDKHALGGNIHRSAGLGTVMRI
jgi:hypothetical protein